MTKLNSKLQPLVAGFIGVTLVFPVTLLAATTGEADGARPNFCAQIDAVAARVSSGIGEREGKLLMKRTERAAQINERHKGRDENRMDHRTDWDTRRGEWVEKMNARATTTEQKAAVAKFVATVDAAIAARRRAVDDAVLGYRAAVDAAIKDRQTTVDAALLALKTETDAALAKAKADCAAGIAPKTVREAYVKSLKTAREKFTTTMKNLEKRKDALKTSIENRKAAIEKAVLDFKAAIEAARIEFKNTKKTT